MKKAFAIIACLWTLLGICGCGANPPSETEMIKDNKMEIAPEIVHEATQEGTTGSSPADTESKILIAYFTWADNTVVEDESRIDVDAATSASVLVPGNAARIAGWIQERTGGDLFSIVVTNPYSSDYDECLNRAADEKAANDRPDLAYHVENMEQYDVVFLGYLIGGTPFPWQSTAFWRNMIFQGKQ